MTRKQLMDIMKKYIKAKPMPECIFGFDKAANSILYAFDKEREGEVVLGNGLMKWHKDQTEIVIKRPSDTWVTMDNCDVIDGKRGQLIFRPTKGDK